MVRMSRVIEPLPGYSEPYGLLAAVLLDGTNEWRWEVDQELGPDATTWRARPVGASIGAVFLHIISVEVFWFEQIALGRAMTAEERKQFMVDEIDVDEGRWPDPPAQPISWYFALHDKIRARTLESIREWPPASDVIAWEGRPDRNRTWVLGHVIQHEAYHGGQIVLLCDLWQHREGAGR